MEASECLKAWRKRGVLYVLTSIVNKSQKLIMLRKITRKERNRDWTGSTGEQNDREMDTVYLVRWKKYYRIKSLDKGWGGVFGCNSAPRLSTQSGQ